MPLPFRITRDDEEESYTTLLLHPSKPILYLGTSHGCVEFWNLSEFKKTAELRYLDIDDFGEKIQVDDPVVAIEPNIDFSLLYVLMGNAAYCVDVDLKVIIQQIPISEKVISGSVSLNSGNIGVITEVGYMSEWSPKFYERIASHELMDTIPNAFITYNYMDNLILVLAEELIIFGKEDEKRFIANISAQEVELNIQQLIGSLIFDLNHLFSCWLDDNQVIINDTASRPDFINKDHLLFDGRTKAVDLLISKIEELSYSKNYIDDFRLHRRGKDRYVAEADGVKGSSSTSTVKKNRIDKQNKSEARIEDSKTLDYAFEEFIGEDIHKKSVAQEVISNISERHNVSVQFLQIAWRWGADIVIDFARMLEFETYRRQDKIRNQIVYMLLIVVVQFIFSFNVFSLFSFYLQIFLVIINFYIVFYWSRINMDPKMPWLEEYKLPRRLSIIVPLYILYRLINLYTVFGDLLPDL